MVHICFLALGVLFHARGTPNLPAPPANPNARPLSPAPLPLPWRMGERKTHSDFKIYKENYKLNVFGTLKILLPPWFCLPLHIFSGGLLVFLFIFLRFLRPKHSPRPKPGSTCNPSVRKLPRMMTKQPDTEQTIGKKNKQSEL